MKSINSRYLSKLVLASIYIVIIFPISILFKIFKIDPLFKYFETKKTYWKSVKNKHTKSNKPIYNDADGNKDPTNYPFW